MTIMGQRVCVRVEAGVYASVNMCRFTPDFDFTYVVTGDYSSCQRLLVETLKKRRNLRYTSTRSYSWIEQFVCLMIAR